MCQKCFEQKWQGYNNCNIPIAQNVKHAELFRLYTLFILSLRLEKEPHGLRRNLSTRAILGVKLGYRYLYIHSDTKLSSDYKCSLNSNVLDV